MGGEYEKGTYRGAVLYRTGVWCQLFADNLCRKKYTVSADLYKIDGKTKVWSEPMVIEATDATASASLPRQN